MKSFVFRVGPLEHGTEQSNAYFVFPGRSGAQTFLDAHDDSALHDIMDAYQGEPLSVEPQLREAAGRVGLPVEDYDPQRAHYLGLVTFDLALPGALTGVENEGLVYQFGVASALYVREEPWKSRRPARALEVAYTGTVRGWREARILGNGTSKGLATYYPEDADRLRARGETGDLRGAMGVDTLGVSFDDGMPFAVSAMRRAYGIAQLPVPIKVRDGRPTAVGDEDLLLLAATLRAIAMLREDDQSSGFVKVGEAELTAVVMRR